MEEYLITARSVTQAQRMAQLLERRGVRAVVGRVPMGLTGKGCGYVLRQPCGCCGRRALHPRRYLFVRMTGIVRLSYDLF